MSDWLGKQIGKYEIRELLGQGGMGAVYKAYHPALEREVAIKRILTHLVSEPSAIDRFRREAKVLAGLRHPGIVQIHDFDVEKDTFYMVMEFVPGETLRQRLKAIHAQGERMPLAKVLSLFRSITRAVAYAHSQGVIHRDLKPANVLMRPDNQPVLADFGLSKILSRGPLLTTEGVVIGTPEYMSPEQASGRQSDARTDVYALGIMLYEVVTGTLPFTDDSPVGIILKHLYEPPTPPRSINPHLPASIETIIQKMLAKDYTDRYTSAQELLKALDEVMLPLPEDAFETTVLPTIDDGRCPYRGLQTFEAKHAEFFFGRETLTDQLVARIVDLSLDDGSITASRFLAILGASGSGKSSLVRAGLLPALQREGALIGSDQWTICLMKPGKRPLEELAAQLGPILYDSEERLTLSRQLLDNLMSDGRGLNLALRLAWSDASPEQRLLLVVDQFEEVFTLCRDETERQRFIENLLYAAGSDGRAIILLTMRADFYHRCATHRDLARRISAQQVLVGPMNEAELRRAIERPAQQVQLRFEPGLVDTILAEVAEQPGALPLLQHTLLELWGRRQRRVLTLEAYRATGGVAGSIAQRAEQVYADLNPEEKTIVRRVMLRLTQLGEGTEDTRRRINKRELLSGNEQSDLIDRVIQRLADARLVTTTRDTASGAEQVDVAHEALIRGWERLRSWLDEDRAGLLVHRRLTEAVEEWSKNERDPSYLYGGTRLLGAREWSIGHLDDLNVLEREFLYISALHDSVPEAILWDDVFASEDQLAFVGETLCAERLPSEALRVAITSMCQWALTAVEESQNKAMAILKDVVEESNKLDIRLQVLENLWAIGGEKAVSGWWGNKNKSRRPNDVKLLAQLWDRGVHVLPGGYEARYRMLGELLKVRWQQRKEYIFRWIFAGALGSTITAPIFINMFTDVARIAENTLSTTVSGAIGGLVLSCGLSFGELFKDWVRLAVRILGSVIFVTLCVTLFVVVMVITSQAPGLWTPDASRSIAINTLAIGIGTSLGELLPKYSGIGHIILGCLAIFIANSFIIGSSGGIAITLGVVIGTGIARIRNSSS